MVPKAISFYFYLSICTLLIFFNTCLYSLRNATLQLIIILFPINWPICNRMTFRCIIVARNELLLRYNWPHVQILRYQGILTVSLSMFHDMNSLQPIRHLFPVSSTLLSVKLNWEKGKVCWTHSLHWPKWQPRLYWSCSSVVLNDASPLTALPSAWADNW